MGKEHVQWFYVKSDRWGTGIWDSCCQWAVPGWVCLSISVCFSYTHMSTYTLSQLGIHRWLDLKNFSVELARCDGKEKIWKFLSSSGFRFISHILKISNKSHLGFFISPLIPKVIMKQLSLLLLKSRSVILWLTPLPVLIYLRTSFELLYMSI